MTTKASKTLKNLVLLLFIFIIGIILLISLHFFFLKLIDNLDKRTENLKAKMQIGQFIVNDLYKIRSDFYELATTVTNEKGRKLLNNKINENIKELKHSLNILEKGGTLKKTIKLNIVGHSDTIKTINYIKASDDISLEVIDLAPKLIQLQKMLENLNELLKKQSLYRDTLDSKNFMQLNKEIKRFYKSTPSFFNRITENTNRLLYEGNIKLAQLEEEIIKQKKQYTRLEFILILTIVLVVIFLVILIAIQINRNAKKLERQEQSTRGILDAQQSIVVVSNGDYMIDANQALMDFFDGYDSFEDFKRDHICICDFFIDLEDEEYIIDKDYEGDMWFEYILENPNKLHKVAMYKGRVLNYFTIEATKEILDKNSFIVIIVLNNITKEIQTQKQLKKLNDNLEDIVNEKTKELQDLNENLEIKIKEEVEKNREKDKAIIQQGRYAALGEMIGNIAHQWRQPLSAILSTTTSMQLQMQLNIATKEDINKTLESIVKYVKFLNQTIEDFRNFFRKDKELVIFNILDVMNNSLSITSAVYKNSQIKVLFDIPKKEFTTKGFESELSQVFLNILNNAKDILREKDLKEKYVLIKIYEHNNTNVIKIYDNAGGVPSGIKDKIFDPYFTTKHKSQGTGIGLYMSKDIIEKHMNGSLTVTNSDFFVEEKHFFGACFKIELPKL
ncbi:hypothetical protein CP965_06645 [Halarcobacter mediterraneus]|uniref:histidine kinase n=1 Tax=Halarcobacter mediterraneus TaxID=2023153 RepID=A0A4Q1AVK3_9BACT|nr:HAMP domain-containing sensor histidine kinase [Halarcobacter mediterraneus]RXK13476.1 hypothetical protein CP965_06645 [Halarcobacter mediterraneus]